MNTPPVHYRGTKRVLAWPMSRGDYNAYRGWTVPDDEDPSDAGFLVEYTDGGKQNHPKHAGYVSWSPADVFARSYQKTAEPGNLLPHQLRVVEETEELRERLAKLEAFIGTETFAAMDWGDASLMVQQAGLMRQLEVVLSARIRRFTP